MDEVKLEISDYYVLLNLHKALLEAKFHENPDNRLVCASPIIANLCNEIVNILAKMDEKKDKKIGWDGWRKLENQSFYKDRAIKNAILNDRWLEMSNEDKWNNAISLISPFKATDEEIINFIKEVDEEFLIRNTSK